MTDLAALAASLRVSERTLRRAAGHGDDPLPSLRRAPTQSPDPRTALPGEPLVGLQRPAPRLPELRTVPNVRLAVLFGSVARGDDSEGSDIDVFVRLGDRSLRARAQILGRLEAATGREIQLIEGDEANPLLLADLLREGRVLVDRDEGWAELLAGAAQIAAAAAAERAALEREVLVGAARLRGGWHLVINAGGLGRRIPTPILQRLSGIATDLKVLKLILDDVGPDDYRAGLKSRIRSSSRIASIRSSARLRLRPTTSSSSSNSVLRELDIAPVDGPRDIDVFVAERMISARLGDHLVTIHRGRNMLTHDYPDLRRPLSTKAPKNSSRCYRGSSPTTTGGLSASATPRSDHRNGASACIRC